MERERIKSNRRKSKEHSYMDFDLHIGPKLHCQVNKGAVEQLIKDSPTKRRRAYLEFKSTNSRQILADLAKAGFDMCTLKRLRTLFSRETYNGFRCLITGSSETILDFLLQNHEVSSASIDLPEYSWLSSSNQNRRLA